MNIEEIRIFCLSKKGVVESFPFNETTLVFKVRNKIFALMNINGEAKLSVKCEPELAIELREKYSYVNGAFHMNKKHWNSIIVKFSDDNFLIKQINNSYNIVLRGASKN